MAEETITLFRVKIDEEGNTQEYVKTIADLKNNIRDYKNELSGLEIGSQKYNETLANLQVNQAALKDAMHATTGAAGDETISLEDVSRAAKGLGTSYNALVKQMAVLDQQFRATDDVVKRAEIGKQINDINKQLKDMDAQRGKYGRNVGDYFNAIQRGLKGTNGALGLIGKQPVIMTIGILASTLGKIAEKLKENETAVGSIKKLGDALKPVAEFFSGILEKIAGWLSKAVDWLLELGNRAGIDFGKIVAGAVGVGNALKEFILTPIRTIVNAVKGLGNVMRDVFTGQWKKIKEDAKTALDGIGEAFTKGFSFKANFEEGQRIGAEFAAGLGGSKAKKAAEGAGKEIAEAALKGVEEVLKDIDKRMDAGIQARIDAEKQAAQEAEELAAAIADTNAGMTESIQAELDAQLGAEYDAMMKEREINQQRVQTFVTFASSIGNLASSIAQIYEADADADEAAAQKAKALKVASAIINTISGAVSAFTSTWGAAEIPLSTKMVLAPVNAAAVLAAGYAQVKQIQAVKVGKGGSQGAAVSAPTMPTSVTAVRSVTNADEEERLNQMASKNRVYILASDLQAERNSSRVLVAETAF